MIPSTLETIVASTGAAPAASAVTVTPAGNIAATDVQTAIAELDTEKVPVAGTYATADTDAVTFKVGAEVANRFVANGDGKLEWGDGTNALDTNIYRSAANILKTDDAVVVGGASISVGTNPAATGGVRLPNSVSMVCRNAANDADAVYYGSNAANDAVINSNVTGTSVRLQIGASSKLSVAATTVTLADGVNFVFNATNGTKLGTATNQKVAFWNATPVVQPTTAVAGAAMTANSGTAVNDASTFAGYTIGQVVAALRSTGLLA